MLLVAVAAATDKSYADARVDDDDDKDEWLRSKF